MNVDLYNVIINIFIGLVLTLTVFYVYLKYYVFLYWHRQGIEYLEPSFPFGNFGPTLRQKAHFGELVARLYHQTNERFIGIFAVTRPALIVRDPELVRAIFIKDFQHFSDRGVYIDEVQDPLSGHLFALSGEKWRNLRGKLTPVFTSGKLKAMFSTLLHCGVPLQKYLKTVSVNNEVIEVREIAARFMTDIIASVAFGLDINSIETPNTAFRRVGRQTFEHSIKNGIRAFSLFIFPKLQRSLKMKSVDDDVEEYIVKLVKQTIQHREENNVVRKDLLQLLIQLRNNGDIAEDGQWEAKISNEGSAKNLSFNEIAAQAWVFYMAGFETSSSTMGFTLYELAQNPDIQRKVHQEIDEVLVKHNNEITYESMADMKYLESCIDETLRKYPIIPILNRECTKSYKIPGTNKIIEKGTAVIIPVLGFQNDPKFYRNPSEFSPHRFDKSNSENKTFNEMPYMPFGDGPRNCIGVRLGKMQTKIGLFLMLEKCKFLLAGNTLNGLTFSPLGMVLSPEGGIQLKVTSRF